MATKRPQDFGSNVGVGNTAADTAAGCAWQITPDAPNFTLNNNTPSCRR